MEGEHSMYRKPIAFSVTILGAAAVAWVAACSSSSGGDDNGTPEAGNDGGTDSGHHVDSGHQTDSGHHADAGHDSSVEDAGPPPCTGPATEALIDDMTGTSISFTPPSCGTKGSWSFNKGPPGSLTTPAAEDGGAFKSPYSPLPSGFPGTVVIVDAGSPASDAGLDGAVATDGGIDGAAPGPQALCLAGTTGATQYNQLQANLEFASSSAPPDGGIKYIPTTSGMEYAPPPALINASSYSGIQFWLWVSPSTVAEVTSGLEVELFDKNELPGFGVCDQDAGGANACGAASADVSGSAAAMSQSAGPLFGADSGGEGGSDAGDGDRKS